MSDDDAIYSYEQRYSEPERDEAWDAAGETVADMTDAQVIDACKDRCAATLERCMTKLREALRDSYYYEQNDDDGGHD